MEFPVRALDGTITNLEWRSRSNFVPGLHFCVARDLTTRDAAQRALRESEERYRAFVGNSSEAVWRFELEEPVPTALDPDEQIDLCYRYGYLAECNEVMARMYGFSSPEEVVGARLGDMLVREKPENLEFLRAFIASGYRLVDAQSHEVDREGNEKHFVNNLIGVIENGFILRAWGTQRDITEQQLLLTRLESLADITAVLGSTLDYDQTLRAVADAAVPRFADACFIDVIDGRGDSHRVAAKQQTSELSQRFDVPVTAHGRTLGALTFANASRRFTQDDVLFAQDLGRR